MIRNLLYFVCPFANYKWNIEQLLKRWPIFTGKKIVAIALDRKFDAPEIVKSLFPTDSNLEFIETKNHPILWEVAAFPALLLRASQFESTSVTAYAHAKGVSRKGSPAVQLWANALYHYNFDNIQNIDTMLKKFPIVGCLKRRGNFLQFPASKFHYSGTFFSFRNKDVFAKKNWFDVSQTRYGTEGWPGKIFKDEEAGCVFGDGVGDLYKWSYISNLLSNEPHFKSFIAENNALGLRFDQQRKLKRHG